MGEPAAVTVGITAEASPVTAVEVEVPDEFRVTGGGGADWRVDPTGSSVRFTGGSVPPSSCGYVTVEGVAEEEGTFKFLLAVRTADDAVLRHDTPPFHHGLVQLVYAGVEPPITGAGSGGADPLSVAGWLLVGAGLLGAVLLGLGRTGVLTLPSLGGRRAAR